MVFASGRPSECAVGARPVHPSAPLDPPAMGNGCCMSDGWSPASGSYVSFFYCVGLVSRGLVAVGFSRSGQRPWVFHPAARMRLGYCLCPAFGCAVACPAPGHDRPLSACLRSPARAIFAWSSVAGLRFISAVSSSSLASSCGLPRGLSPLPPFRLWLAFGHLSLARGLFLPALSGPLAGPATYHPPT